MDALNYYIRRRCILHENHEQSVFQTSYVPTDPAPGSNLSFVYVNLLYTVVSNSAFY